MLVWHDLADFPAGDHRARFVRKFGAVGEALGQAASGYKRAVQEGAFPAEEHSF